MTPGPIATGKKKIAFPRVADYSGVFRYWVEQCLDQTYILQPKCTHHTLEVGARYSPDSVCTPFKTALGSMIEALDLGADTLVVTNAAGAVNKGYSVGDIMLISDHIKLFADSPLRGPNAEEFGPRFPDMSHIYTPALRDSAREIAKEQGITLREGVYMYFPGPQYETPAEVRAARLLGADAVGMSTVPEAIAAAHCGMSVLGFTLCTNMAAGVLDQPLDGEEVIAAGQAAGPRFAALVKACLACMA